MNRKEDHYRDILSYNFGMAEAYYVQLKCKISNGETIICYQTNNLV